LDNSHLLVNGQQDWWYFLDSVQKWCQACDTGHALRPISYQVPMAVSDGSV